MIASPQWLALVAFGARPQRPLWASASVKDPAYPDTRCVVDLVAPGVVNTMPEGTLRAVADHGVIPADSIRAYYPGAQRVLVRLAAVGIDYQDVVQSLDVLQLARRGIGLVISRRRRPGKSAPHSRRGPGRTPPA